MEKISSAFSALESSIVAHDAYITAIMNRWHDMKTTVGEWMKHLNLAEMELEADSHKFTISADGISYLDKIDQSSLESIETAIVDAVYRLKEKYDSESE